MDEQIKTLLDSFQWEYTANECPEMFKVKKEKWQAFLDQCELFEEAGNEETIPDHIMLYLLNYISDSQEIECFINECIAPYVHKIAVGKDIAEEFYRSIEIYNQQVSNVDDTNMVVILTPIFTAASLIQNAYLFVNDLVMNKESLNDYETDELGTYDMYRYIISLILIPLKEWVLYHLDDEVKGIPVLIVSSLGTLKSDFMSEHAEEFLNRVSDGIRSQIGNINFDEDNEEEELN